MNYKKSVGEVTGTRVLFGQKEKRWSKIVFWICFCYFCHSATIALQQIQTNRDQQQLSAAWSSLCALSPELWRCVVFTEKNSHALDTE